MPLKFAYLLCGQVTDMPQPITGFYDWTIALYSTQMQFMYSCTVMHNISLTYRASRGLSATTEPLFIIHNIP